MRSEKDTLSLALANLEGALAAVPAQGPWKPDEHRAAHKPPPHAWLGSGAGFDEQLSKLLPGGRLYRCQAQGVGEVRVCAPGEEGAYDAVLIGLKSLNERGQSIRLAGDVDVRPSLDQE